MPQAIPIEEKHPDAKVIIGIDWTDMIGDSSVTIDTSTWGDPSASGVTFANGVIRDDRGTGGLVETFTRVDGGTEGSIAYCENKITLSDTRVLVFTVCIIVTTKVPYD